VAAGLAASLQFSAGGPALQAPEPWHTLQLFVLLFFLGGSFQEEFGWAYAIDRLQRRWPALPADAALGVLWGLWHLPLFFIPGTGQSHMPLWSFLIATVAARIVMVWIYNGANRSILAMLLFHTVFNLSLNVFPVLSQESGVTQTTWLYYVALLTVAAFGPALALRRQPAE
jgi:membrane protease YdiL (CAAX protease family)